MKFVLDSSVGFKWFLVENDTPRLDNCVTTTQGLSSN